MIRGSMHELGHAVVPTIIGIALQNRHKVGDLIPQVLQQKDAFNFLGHILSLVSYRWCSADSLPDGALKLIVLFFPRML